jgi:hypothetical protein
MGLDLYVGPLTRYHLGDWLTVMQQVGEQMGYNVRVVRADEQQEEERVTDPDVVLDAVHEWQQWLGGALGNPVGWPESPTQQYWTDKPDWDGFGAVVLLAAYDERPDLRPFTEERADDPRDFTNAPAYQAASEQPECYFSLLGGVEWWLPLTEDPVVIEASTPTGHQVRMASVDRLVGELRLLAERTNVFAGQDPAVFRQNPPERGAPVDDAARFGLAVMLDLAEKALEHHQPLLLDY